MKSSTRSPPKTRRSALPPSCERATVEAVLSDAAAHLRRAGIEAPRRDARLLLTMATGLTAERILAWPGAPLAPADRHRFEDLVRRRAAHEPVSRIAGVREFWSLPFRLTPETLDPRPDSETMVEAVLAAIPDRSAPLRLLDLGTGSGCLLLALLHELPRARGVGVDIAPGVCAAARENARFLGLDGRAGFVAGDWTSSLAGRFDVVLSNPPYIADADMDRLEAAVARFDPRRALAGGTDGLDAYRTILPEAGRLLAPGGLLAVEIGADQHEAVGGLFSAAGLDSPREIRDLAGIVRCLMAEAPPGRCGPEKRVFIRNPKS